ncbi:hypothetical protein HanXRQr2_Chr05g0209661 [Helianthus annuus]|uniref:Uncharacterized protein n=1 Tax=Helianthus annuus TaxID=4232 RepID=A0A9K3IYC4_HELAN|nr:hypothetical protein HanXRQr2_Chr05g0209661 [Helianthus annuus]
MEGDYRDIRRTETRTSGPSQGPPVRDATAAALHCHRRSWRCCSFSGSLSLSLSLSLSPSTVTHHHAPPPQSSQPPQPPPVVVLLSSAATKFRRRKTSTPTPSVVESESEKE